MRRRPRNIVRYEHHYFYGWCVAIKRQGRMYRRYFGDEPNRKASLARAVAWRDKTLARLPPPRRFKRRYRLNKTGEVGVSRGINRTRAGRRIPYYAASWFDQNGRQRKRSFSVAKYGADKARSLAVRTRRHALAEMLQPQAASGATTHN